MSKNVAELALTQPQARRFLLAYQNLWPPRALSGKTQALAFVRRVGCIQFDPLDIAGKNPELVLQARVGDFTPAMLDELLYTDRALVDGWDKQMAIYPVEDWPALRRRREDAKRQFRSMEAVAEITPQIRAAIEQRGPLSSIDLEHKGKVDWWWAPTSLARAALESMYLGGELVVHHKVHTRKVYDLAERHIPAELFYAPDPHPDDEDYREWYILRRLGNVGLLWNRGGALWPFDGARRKAVLQRLKVQGKILEVQVEGITFPLYLRAQDRSFLEETLAAPEPAQRAAFVAPLDNLVWERSLIETLFGFDYRWEVYVPQKLRKYGYYVLPVLYGDRFIARVEPARQRKSNTLTIKGWWWEPGIVPDDAMLAAIQKCLAHFCAFLNIQSIQYDGRSAEPDETARLVEQLADGDNHR
ncbi:MAG: winged helix-turn-helix domain-containing protein [Chloroflexota bacterium]